MAANLMYISPTSVTRYDKTDWFNENCTIDFLFYLFMLGTIVSSETSVMGSKVMFVLVIRSVMCNAINILIRNSAHSFDQFLLNRKLFFGSDHEMILERNAFES